MINESNSTDALALDVTSTNLDLGLEQERQTLPFKNEQIAMLEERLSKQSVELASLREREDEQKGSATSEDVQADLADDSVKSSRCNTLFGFMPGWRSKGGFIGNMIKFDKRDSRNEDLRVEFPAEGRRRTIEMDERPTVTVNAEPVVHHEQGQGALRRSIRRRSRKMSLKVLRHLVSSRKIGSTVLFPNEDDDYSLGFD